MIEANDASWVVLVVANGDQSCADLPEGVEIIRREDFTLACSPITST